MKTCKTCRYWSEMLAMCNDGVYIEAMCLSQDSPKKQQWMKEYQSCEKHQAGTPIDDPAAVAEP